MAGVSTSLGSLSRQTGPVAPGSRSILQAMTESLSNVAFAPAQRDRWEQGPH